MCLSTVYIREEDRTEPIARNVATVHTREDGTLVFTDIMGAATVVDGELETVDLMDNTIYVRKR